MAGGVELAVAAAVGPVDDFDWATGWQAVASSRVAIPSGISLRIAAISAMMAGEREGELKQR